MAVGHMLNVDNRRHFWPENKTTHLEFVFSTDDIPIRVRIKSIKLFTSKNIAIIPFKKLIAINHLKGNK